MRTPFLVDPPIYLRPLRREDLGDAYLGWLNDPEVTRYLETGAFPTTPDDLERFYAASVGSTSQVLLAIADCEHDAHIGNVKLGPINWVHRRATFAILVGDRRWWGRGIGTKVTRLVVEYAFHRLDLRRVDLGVHAAHAAAVRSYERVGFREEGRFREDLFHEGRYVDRLWMGLLRHEYEAARALAAGAAEAVPTATPATPAAP